MISYRSNLRIVSPIIGWLFVLFFMAVGPYLNGQTSEDCSFFKEEDRLVSFRFSPASPIEQSSDFPKIYFGLLDSIAPGQISILGDVRWQGKTFEFFPKFPFQENQFYTIQINEKETFFCKSPILDESPPQLYAIYPSIEQVPANLLKIYLHFNEPMQPGKSREKVHVINQEGDTLKDIFLELQPELWNDNFTRITMWLDPGRIKRALGPNRRDGSPIVKGENYSLVINQNWKNQRGLILAKSYQKNIVVLPPIRSRVDPDAWTLGIPSANTKLPIEIQFDRPLDHSLLQKSFSVWGPLEQKLATSVLIVNKEQKLQIIPEEIWQAGTYAIRIDSALEDLAGNNLNRSFDVDLSKEKTRVEEDYFWIKVQIKK